MAADTNDGGFIRIGNREIWDAVQLLRSEVQRLGDNSKQLADHETRLRTLEGRFVGVAVAAVTVVLTGVGAFLWRVIGS